MHRAGWVSVAVVPDFSWPDQAVEIGYAGREFLLLPGTPQLACDGMDAPLMVLEISSRVTDLATPSRRPSWA